jgi:hypothetical protein
MVIILYQILTYGEVRLDQNNLLKNKNRKWLIFYLLGHIVLFALFSTFVIPTFDGVNGFLSKLKSPSGFFPLLSFPLAIVLEGLIHSNHKAILIYWKANNPYPGSKAFTSIAPKDPRISMARLEKLFPDGLPQDPQDQNNNWYRLYRKYSDQPIVNDAHRFFLLTRDLAALTAILIPFCVTAHIFWQNSVEVVFYHILVLTGLFILICISSQNYGKRFVANVLVEATLNPKEGNSKQ